MNITGIIAEYNPFHFGHKYQINELKKSLNTDVVVIMSGDFVQRGECSIIDKYKRANFAINNGANLVIELATPFSLQSAENFAFGAVKSLNELNVVDYLCFGYEADKKEDLFSIADFQLEFKNEINDIISQKMKEGFSYAVAYKDACYEVGKDVKNFNIDENFFISNNILSIEYIKSLKRLNSNIIPYPIKRKGENYNSENFTSNNQLSASAIRKAIYENELSKIKDFAPKEVINEIKEITLNKNLPNYDKLLSILKYNILIDNINFEDIVNYESGMINLLKNNYEKYNDFQELISNMQSKRYKKVRLQRFILNYILNINIETWKLYNNIDYIKVLGFDQRGQSILKKIKENSNLKIITKNKDTKQLDSSSIEKYRLEEKYRKIYKILTNQKESDGYINLFHN